MLHEYAGTCNSFCVCVEGNNKVQGLLLAACLQRRGHRSGQKRMQAGKNVVVAKLEGTCIRKQAWSR